MDRRSLLKFLGLLPLVGWGFLRWVGPRSREKDRSMIQHLEPIDLHWPTQDPFLFCAHHFDHYPAGDDQFGVKPTHFIGRNLGADFQEKDGFRLYHGREIPGFPLHPHRGFETITIVRQGLADHADSLGASGRYGEGDVQWMTAGSGIQHSEMFPLVHRDKGNTLELFQLWLNLPRKNKLVAPEFKMLWADSLPRITAENLEVSVISGEFGGTRFFEAPKNSWAADPGNGVTILMVKLKKGAAFSYPAQEGRTRSLYFFDGDSASLNGQKILGKQVAFVSADVALEIESSGVSEFLLLEAKPIGEPVVQHGPFVMTTRAEIEETFRDYHRTQFGGWRWSREDMIHGPGTERFAKYPDGRLEKPKA